MKYVLQFSGEEHINFREAELTSIFQLIGLNPQDCFTAETDLLMNITILDLPDHSSAIKLAERSILIKSIYQYWCSSDSFDGIFQEISILDKSLTDHIINGKNSIKIHISSINKKLSSDDRLGFINKTMNSFHSVKAPISLASPQVYKTNYLLITKHEVALLIEFAAIGRLPDFVMGFTAESRNRDMDSGALKAVYCGLKIAGSKRKEILNKYNLSHRAYLGNTTMDVCLASIAANLALCKENNIIFDPFLGSGGCVIAASVWGAFGFGSDIDFALIHGIDRSPRAGQGFRANDECLKKSYRQYGLDSRYMDVLVADASLLNKTLLSRNGIFDAIVTDPPYGVRESSKRISKQSVEKPASLMHIDEIKQITGGKYVALVPDENGMAPIPHDLPHYPHKEEYPLEETFNDLLNFAAEYLVPGGRIVFWIPILRKLYSGTHCLPYHPRLRRLSFCEQVLNQRNSRALITMQKLYPEEIDIKPQHPETRHPDIISQFKYEQPHAKQKTQHIED